MSATKPLQLARLLPFVFCFSILLFVQGVSYALDSSVSKSSARARNITRSADRLEVNPRFVGNDAYIVYLEFCGNWDNPEPWGYRLMMTDRNGHTLAPLSKLGVVDFVVLPSNSEIKYLTVPEVNVTWSEENYYSEITNWQIWQLDMRTHKKVLQESSNGRPLKAGYALLGVSGLPGTEPNAVTSSSPEGKTVLRASRDWVDGKSVLKYATTDESTEVVFQTEEYKTYTHLNWLPQILWLDEHRFITILFESEADDAFPQTDGLFSIVKFDVTAGSSQVLFRNSHLNPFPRFNLDPERMVLYFQQNGLEGSTELWRLKLENGKVDMVYQTMGDIGESRLSFDGASLVFTEFVEGNLDIMRVDLEPNYVQSFVGTDIE